MSINLKTCSEKELWEHVAVHLKKKGIDTILVGGAVVSIYSNGAYRSGDLDFVKASMFVTKLEESMSELGFKKHGRHFVNPECKHLFVEFPGGTIIKILSPTDCVKDRLATYIYFKAPEGLDQAVLVAKNQEVNFSSIKKWCKNENVPHIFEEFMDAFKRSNNP